MEIFLFKFLFFVLSAISDLVSMVFLKGMAIILVMIIQTLKFPGKLATVGLEYLSHGLMVFFYTLLEVFIGGLRYFVNNVFNTFEDVISGSSGFSSSALGNLSEKIGGVADGVLNFFLEILKEGSEAAEKIINGAWSNALEAITYVISNA